MDTEQDIHEGKPAEALPGLARVGVTFAPTAVLTLVWTHALANVLNAFDPVAGAVWAWPLSFAALLVAGVATLGARRGMALAALPAGVVAALAIAAVAAGALVPALSLVLAGPVAAVAAGFTLRRLPVAVDGAWRRHRVRAALWSVAALLAVVQIARLSTWMSDPASDWFLTTRHPFWSKHECLPAYVHGAELGLRGEDNVYHADHYPGLNPQATPHSEVAHMIVEDPFQYAPQFLLWPAAALGMTHDYPSLRVVWFALQTTALLWVLTWLSTFVGGRAGRLGMWLTPLALSAFPVLHDLQYGQFHLAAVGLAVVGMGAVARGRERLGGLLLAVATLSKIFPGVLLLLLLGQRRYRALGYTAGFAALLTAAAAAVFGFAPFEAFAGYHLPRLQSGAAFAFGEAWPQLRQFIITANHGVYGFVVKLAELGVPGFSAELGVWVNRIYAVLVAVLAWTVGRRRAPADRLTAACTWLGLTGLASLMSTGAFADYVPVTATWLATLLAHRMGRPRVAVLLGVAWFFQYTLAFTTPIGGWFDLSVMLPMSALSTLMMLGLCLSGVPLPIGRVSRAPDARSVRSSRPSLAGVEG